MRRPPRQRAPLGAFAIVVLCAVGALAPTAAADTASFTPEADTYVSSSSPKKNFGRSSYLKVGAPARRGRAGTRRAYLRFNVRLPRGASVRRAGLRLYAKSRRASGGIFVASVSSRWRELGATYRRRPVFRERLARLRGWSRPGWKRIALPRRAIKRGRVSLGIASRNSRAKAFRSRRRARYRPRLVVEYSVGSGGAGAGGGTAVVMAAGDHSACSGSSCATSNSAKVRDVIRGQSPDLILGLGDFQYSYGSHSALLAGFDTIYGPKPGGLWPLIRPTAGPTHDISSGSNTADYQAYWGRDPLKPYSFDVGDWHVVQMPSPTFRYDVDPPGMLAWLNADLRANTKRCTLAFWHEPYWTSPTSGHDRTDDVRPWVQALYDHGAELLLNGHQHSYERFAPQNPSDQHDPARGIRAFVVGTGGVGHYSFTGTAPNSESRNDDTYGALRLALRAGGYDFAFLPAAGGAYRDSGSGSCH